MASEQQWAAYLLVSPTRSSLAGCAAADQLAELVALLNRSAESPPEIAVLRPWRLATSRTFDSHAAAQHAALRTTRASGVRARLAALKDAGAGDALKDAAPESPAAALVARGAEDGVRLGLDGLTYVEVEFSHPTQPHRAKVVRALVDTGASECDLRQSVIDSLGLPATAEGSYFETAAGRTMHTRAFRARVRVKGFEGAQVEARVNPCDEEDGDDSDSEYKSVASPGEDDVDRALGFGPSTDDAVLGHRALAQLGLIVDCAGRRLRVRDASLERAPSVSFTRTGMHVPLELANPHALDRSLVVHALVDSGSTDLDLDASRLAHLGLAVDPDEAPAQFETAGGVTIEAPIFRAEVRALGRRASVRVSPSEEPCSPEGSDSDGACSPSDDKDEALLGHDALAALGLLVDCSRGVLLADPSWRLPGDAAVESAVPAAGLSGAGSPATQGA